MKKIETRKKIITKIFDKIWINKKFYNFSESKINTDEKYITSPVDWTIAYMWKIWVQWEFISKWWKKVDLGNLIWENAVLFSDYNYLNIYLSPLNRHFFTMPYDGKIEKVFPHNGKAFFPIFLWIENILKIEVFHKAIIANATLSILIDTSFWKLCFIAVWSLNVNHIELSFEENSVLKKWETFGHFSLWSSVILIFPNNFKVLKNEWEHLKIGEKIIEII